MISSKFLPDISIEQTSWFRDPLFWMLLLCSALFLHSGLFQLFPTPGWVDAGIYLGYGIQFPELIARFVLTGNTYHAARLPYVLPLYFCHLLFGDVAGHLMQVTGWYLLGVAAASSLGHVWGGRRGALLAGAFMAFNPFFIATVTLSGITGATLVLALWAARVVFSPSGLRYERAPMAIAGVLAALALATHLFFVVPLTGMILAHRAAGVSTGGRHSRAGLGVFVLAFLLTAVVQILVFFALHLGLSPVLSQLYATGSSLKGMGGAYRLPWAQWGAPTRLWVPLLLMLWVTLFAHGDKRRYGLRVAGWLVIFPLSVMAAYDLLIPGVTLQYWFYFALLLPGWAIALALNLRHAQLGNRMAFFMVVIMVLPSVSLYLFPGIFDLLETPGFRTELFWAFGTAGLIFLLLYWYGLVAANNLLRQAGFAGWALVVMACLTVNTDTWRVFRAATGLDYKEAFVGAVAFSRAVENSGNASLKPKIMFDRTNLNRGLGPKSIYPLRYRDSVFELNYFDMLASLYLWDKSLVSITDPSDVGPLATLEGLPAYSSLVLLGRDQVEVATILQKIKQAGLVPVIESGAEYKGRQFGWQLLFVRLSGAKHE